MGLTIGYCRLSRDDGDDESQSIVNQRKIINDYAISNNMNIDKWYIDDGVSGYTMDRPDFNNLKDDLNKGLIDTIIVKDLSRLGRHNAKVNLFLENIIEIGKCVQTVNDNYNSYDEQANDILGIQTWVNEKYVRDTSKKVIKSIRALQNEGKYISSVPYGYKKDPYKKGEYYIDERAAKYVRIAYDMYANGYGVASIAKHLTDIGAPTLTMLMKLDLDASGRTYRGNVATKWNTFTIKNMLENDFYIGTLTLNKTRRRSINGKKVQQDKNDYLVFPNKHEPIIDIETFNLVQDIHKERTKNGYKGRRVQSRPNIYSGLLYCGDCGKRLTSTSNAKNTRYVCSTYNVYGTSYCQSHCIKESDITESLIVFLKQCIANIDNVLDKLDTILNDSIQETTNKADIKQLNDTLNKYENELQALFELKMKDTMKNPNLADIIESNYSKMIDEKCQLIKSLKLQINDSQEANNELDNAKESFISAKGILNNIVHSSSLTKKQVQSILTKIVVYDDGGIDFHLKGDLDSLVSDKITVQLCQELILLEHTYNYFYNTNNNNIVTPTGAWKYTTDKGVKIGYPRYKEFFQQFIDNKIVKYLGYNKGYLVSVSKEQFANDYSLNIDGKCSSWLPNNDVILVVIKNTVKWISNINAITTKRLF